MRTGIGAAVTLAELEDDPHPLFARLRAHEPVAWVPALDGWLVTRRDVALAVMRDDATFTVDDPRFSTAQVVGPSMLSRDGEAHGRHREPFARQFRRAAVRERFTGFLAAEADRLLDALAPAGRGDLRAQFAGPLAARTMAHALGVEGADTDALLAAYAGIVAAVEDISAGRPADGSAAFATLAAMLPPERLSDQAVILFGGIDTTEGMIANAIVHLLSHPDQLALARAEPEQLAAAIEESLRLEPAAAAIDRYATADVELAGARIARGDLVRISIAAANRDPAVFPAPDRFDVRRGNARLHIAFAHGPHVCLGMHLARLEAHTALGRVFDRLEDLRLDGAARPRGLIFRRPPSVPALWNTA
jgi:cytochrome P450